MLDDNGHLLKLLEEKSLKEKAFYEIIFIDEAENKEWFELRKYLPRYYGTVNIFNGTEDCILYKTDVHYVFVSCKHKMDIPYYFDLYAFIVFKLISNIGDIIYLVI